MVTVKTGPGIKAPDRAMTKEVPKIPSNKTILSFTQLYIAVFFYEPTIYA
jgi:hypothetical protein